MSTRTLGIVSSITLLGIAVFHNLAIAGYWYWTFRWLDIPVHFLGGFGIGVTVLWLLRRFHISVSSDTLAVIIPCAALLIGAGWEIFEYTTGAFLFESQIFPDTFLDLIMDTLGGIAAYSVFSRYENTLYAKNKFQAPSHK